jgi:heme-degrading monooxygenase HmoA
VPQPLHYAVIFTSRRKPLDEGYTETAARQPGFLGVETARSEDGLGITISYWESLEAVAAWGTNAEHLIAQKYGREKWYEWFSLRIAAVQHVRSFGTGAAKDEGPPAVADGPS